MVKYIRFYVLEMHSVIIIK